MQASIDKIFRFDFFVMKNGFFFFLFFLCAAVGFLAIEFELTAIIFGSIASVNIVSQAAYIFGKRALGSGERKVNRNKINSLQARELWLSSSACSKFESKT